MLGADYGILLKRIADQLERIADNLEELNGKAND